MKVAARPLFNSLQLPLPNVANPIVSLENMTTVLEGGSGNLDRKCSIQDLLAAEANARANEERYSQFMGTTNEFEVGHLTDFVISDNNLGRRGYMEYFPKDKVDNFKHVVYNLLVEYYNSKTPQECLVSPCSIQLNGEEKEGFQFNKHMNPDKRIPELYAVHARNARLDLQNQESVFIQDCYKFYLRSALELLGKYFTKSPILPESAKYAFLYDEDSPLFIAGGSLKDAEERISGMKTRARKRTNSSVQTNSKKAKK